MATLGERIVEGLEAYGIDTVFGIPGVHTVELYRGLARSSIRHVTPRHEQGAGFMADGYYRATGRVAAAFVITGPGVTNILTPMAQAYADSIPMLVVSSVNRTRNLGMGGDLHEIRNQSLIAAQAAAFSHTITHPDQFPGVLARAWSAFESARPRPVHIEVPLDLFAAEVTPRSVKNGGHPARPAPHAEQVALAQRILATAERPLIIAGGGACAAPEIAVIAEAYDAPVVMTTNARGVLSNHPLGVPASPSLESIKDFISEADVVLAVGTEFGRTDFDMYDRAAFEVPGKLIRVDIDAEQVARGPSADLAIVCDSRRFCAALAELAMPRDIGPVGGTERARVAREAAIQEIGPKYRAILGFLESIRDTLPDAPMVCDSTQAAYAGNLFYDAPSPRKWFNASTGYGALGYGLPAAIGAARALDGPVVCICGDGGVQFSLAELGCAVEEKLRVTLLVWNNRGYGEIKAYMVQNQIAPVGVDLHTPDFVAIGRAYGCEAMTLEARDDLPELLREAAGRDGPTLIEIDEALILGGLR